MTAEPSRSALPHHVPLEQFDEPGCCQLEHGIKCNAIEMVKQPEASEAGLFCACALHQLAMQAANSVQYVLA
jgi:hypothetical protein